MDLSVYYIRWTLYLLLTYFVNLIFNQQELFLLVLHLLLIHGSLTWYYGYNTLLLALRILLVKFLLVSFIFCTSSGQLFYFLKSISFNPFPPNRGHKRRPSSNSYHDLGFPLVRKHGLRKGKPWAEGSHNSQS